MRLHESSGVLLAHGVSLAVSQLQSAQKSSSYSNGTSPDPFRHDVRTIKPGDPRKRLSDGDGLVLLLFVDGSGEHGWRFDYRFGGKRNMLSLGTYPDTTLAIARRKADAARHLLAEGFDPSQKRKGEWETLVKVREAPRCAALGAAAQAGRGRAARPAQADRLLHDGLSR